MEPATFERCALIRDWLADHGVDRVTLLVIPAPHLHPFFHHRPDLMAWLLDCRDQGDAIAQHGLQHRPDEFAGLSAGDTAASLAAGRRMLTLAGSSRAASSRRPTTTRPSCGGADGRLRLVGDAHTPRRPRAGRRRPRGLAAPLAARLRTGALAAGGLLRLDVHPGDLDRPRHVLALESVLRRGQSRTAVTYDDVASVAAAPSG